MQHLGLAAGTAGRSQVVGSPVRPTHHQATSIHLWPHSPQRLAGQYGRLPAVAQSGGSTGQSSSDVAGLLSAVFQPTQPGSPAYPHLLYPASENAASSGSSMQPAAQSALSNSASSAASAAPQSPAGTILQQWLQQDSDGTAQEDPIQAARRLQNFLAQYAGQYDVQTDERITVASDRLQAFIDRHATSANNIFKDAAATAVEGAAAAPAYQAHLAQPLGSLNWASQSATLGQQQQQLGPMAGTAASSMGVGLEDGGQAEQLGEAANTLRGLVGQLAEARDAYGTLADPQEKAALTAMLAPLQALAERLSSAATLTPMSPPPQGMASGILTAMVGNAAGMGGADGAAGAQQQHNDPMLGVVEGLNGALVVDSGLRDFAVAVRSLGESLAAQMSGAWSVAPTLTRVVAYIAAVAGVLLVMRTRVPALMAARDPRTGQVLSGRDRTQSSLDSRTRTLTGSGSSSNSRTPEVLPPLPAGMGAFSRRAVSPLAAMDKDSGLGDTRLPSEILATDPYAARKVVYDTSIDVPAAASISSGSRRMAAGPALTVAGAAAAYAAEAKPGVRMKSLEAPPDRQPAASPVAGNWGGVPSDRRDWWRLGAGKASAGSSSNDDSSTSRSNTRAGAGGSALGNASSAGGMWGNASRGFGNGNGSSGPGQGAGMRESAYALAASGSAGSEAYVAPVSYTRSGSRSMLSGGGGGVDGTWRATPLRGSAPSQTATWEQQQQQALAQQPPADVMAPPQIKAQLLQVVQTLSPLAAVLPGAGGPSGEVARGRADALLAALEALPSPVVRPLVDTMGMSRQPNIPIQYGADARLLGDWRLIYASSGEEYSTPEPATSLFAQALALLERVPGVSMACVQQRLERDLSSSMDHLTHPWAPLPAGMSMGEASGRGVSQTQPNASAEHGQGVTATGGVGAAARPGNHRSVVRTVNSAEFAFGPFGRWRISVEGRWVDAGDGASAEAWFESFRLAPLELLGLPLAGLPEVRVPVPPLLRASSEWRTTYLDGQLRIGRSSQGGVFLFQKL